jgi:hypothetical protein
MTLNPWNDKMFLGEGRVASMICPGERISASDRLPMAFYQIWLFEDL